jgi:hypothetical protein
MVASMNTGAQSTTITPTWDIPTANQTLTLITNSTSSGLGGDHFQRAWGLVSPAAKTANLNFSSVGDVVASTIAITCIDQVDISGGVDGATNPLGECVDNVGGTNCTIASAGTAGNLLYAAVGFRGADMDPVTLNMGWTESIEVIPTSGAGDAVVMSAVAAAPLDVDWDGQATDELAGLMFEIEAEATGLDLIIYRRLTDDE